MSIKEDSLVSIIMACYNSEQYISATLSSVISQTYSNWELIITDDASTDNTVKVIKEFRDKRIKLITTKHNCGAQIARNICLENINAESEFVAVLDSDDIWDKNKLELQIFYLCNNLDVSIVGSNVRYFENDPNNVVYKTHIKSGEKYAITNIPFCSPLAHSSVVFRRKDFKGWTIYDESFSTSQDYDFMFRAFQEGKKIANLEDILVSYRVRKESLSHKNSGMDLNTLNVQCRVAKMFNVPNTEEFVRPINFSNPYEPHTVSNYLKAIRFYFRLIRENRKRKLLFDKGLRITVVKRIYGHTRTLFQYNFRFNKSA